MEEKTVTLKQLYQYVDAYFAEAKEEGFEPQVGDFVDWVASQDEDQGTVEDSYKASLAKLKKSDFKNELDNYRYKGDVIVREGDQ